MIRLRWWHPFFASLGLGVLGPASQLTWPVAAIIIASIVAILVIFLAALVRLEALPKVCRNGKYRFTLQWERMGLARRDQAEQSEDEK